MGTHTTLVRSQLRLCQRTQKSLKRYSRDVPSKHKHHIERYLNSENHMQWALGWYMVLVLGQLRAGTLVGHGERELGLDASGTRAPRAEVKQGPGPKKERSSKSDLYKYYWQYNIPK